MKSKAGPLDLDAERSARAELSEQATYPRDWRPVFSGVVEKWRAREDSNCCLRFESAAEGGHPEICTAGAREERLAATLCRLHQRGLKDYWNPHRDFRRAL
jgi:hypothetical protein